MLTLWEACTSNLTLPHQLCDQNGKEIDRVTFNAEMLQEDHDTLQESYRWEEGSVG